MLDFEGSSLNISAFDFPGATSLKSNDSKELVCFEWTIIKPPPPIPVECILYKPKQNAVATAASTAVPFRKISRPKMVKNKSLIKIS